jgi:hypothetical protein
MPPKPGKDMTMDEIFDMAVIPIVTNLKGKPAWMADLEGTIQMLHEASRHPVFGGPISDLYTGMAAAIERGLRAAAANGLEG